MKLNFFLDFLRDMDAWTWFALIGIALFGIWWMDTQNENDNHQN
jgi:hypothetical protein